MLSAAASMDSGIESLQPCGRDRFPVIGAQRSDAHRKDKPKGRF